MRRCFSLLVVVFILVGSIGMPQLATAQDSAPDISIDMIPLNPDPGQQVTLQATSYGVDLSQSTLSWTYNGRTVANGIGITSIAVIAPAGGTTGTVVVNVSGGGFESASASIFIRPASVDLLWEAADAYTPPFYKGKALLPIEGLVRVTAIPSASAPKNLTYDWSRNNAVLQEVSGYGKSSILFRQSALTPNEKIDVSARSGAFTGSESVTLAPHDTDAIAYQNNEGFINYANGYDTSVSLTTPGVVLHFEPYYFSVPQTIQNDLSITTMVDGDAVNPSQQNEIALSRPATGGTSMLALAITTTVYSLQHLAKTFTLLFN